MRSFSELSFPLLIGALVVFSGCRVVPIQLARVVQIESYTQTFEFDNVTQAENIISKLIGGRNFSIILGEYGSIADEIIAGKLRSEGSFVFIISLVPNNHDLFFAEGFGKFFLIYQNEISSGDQIEEILYSGDFRIIPEQRLLSDFIESGEVPVRFRQYPVRTYPLEPDEEADNKRAYLEGSDLCAIMKIDTSRGNRGVYTIDYSSTEHQVFIGSDDECGSDPNLFVGHITFSYPFPSDSKMIDLKNRRFIKKY